MKSYLVNTACNIIHSDLIKDSKSFDISNIDFLTTKTYIGIYLDGYPIDTISIDFTINSGLSVNPYELASKLSNEFIVKSVEQYNGKFTINFEV